jgi:hypothetical protein
VLARSPRPRASIEASYEALLRELEAHFQVHSHVLGSRPTAADFGLIGPLYAHQYRDPKSGEMMRRLAPSVVEWVQRMQEPDVPGSGELLPDDGIPPTVLPILSRMMREQMPVLVDTAARLQAFAAEHPGEPVPRRLGLHEFVLGGERGERMVLPYGLWMLQRARDVYRELEGTDRERADGLLGSIGGEAFAEFPDPPRLARDGMGVRLIGTR